MHVVGHNDIGTDVRAVRFSTVREFQERFMEFASREEGLPVEGAGCHEVNRRRREYSIQATETFRTQIFVRGIGGHRPPLQGGGFQRVEQLPMDPIETAVAENGDDVFLF